MSRDTTARSIDAPRCARWLVCESSGRWSPAARRFAPEMLSPLGIVFLVPGSHQDAFRLLSTNVPSIVLWEFTRDTLAIGCDCLIQAARVSPAPLQVVASIELSQRQQLNLVELPVSALIRHPEDLRRLRPMLKGYFARHRQLLD